MVCKHTFLKLFYYEGMDRQSFSPPFIDMSINLGSAFLRLISFSYEEKYFMQIYEINLYYNKKNKKNTLWGYFIFLIIQID
jgi:hypothetical protein